MAELSSSQGETASTEFCRNRLKCVSDVLLGPVSTFDRPPPLLSLRPERNDWDDITELPARPSFFHGVFLEKLLGVVEHHSTRIGLADFLHLTWIDRLGLVAETVSHKGQDRRDFLVF